MARLLGFIWVFVLSIFLQIWPGFWPALAQENRGQITVHEDSDYFGFDLATKKDVSLDQCKASCLDNFGCAAFTYNISAKFCFLKSDFGELKSFTGATAGRIVKTGSGEDIGAPQKLSFVAEYLYENARKFRDLIANSKTRTDNPGFIAATQSASQQFADGDNVGATQSLFTALKINPKHQPSWVLLSNASHRRISSNSSQKRLFAKTTISAALNGYRLSRSNNSRAAALASLARGLSSQRQYRAALSAYETSLELNEVSENRSDFVELRRNYGFRVLNHTVDSDNLNPRICVQFSEDLITKNPPASFGGYEDFLNIDQDAPKAIDVGQRQICIEGLEHGRSYKIKLRQGLPSARTEALASDISLDVYVRDRQPVVRFTGANYILSATARRGIPLVTVNTSKANLKLFRIGERALAPLLRDSKFLKQLGTYQVEYLIDDLGEAIWNGSVDIKPELNKEVITSIPIDQALPERKPGIYFLTAKPTGSGPGNSDIRATQWFVISDIGLTTFSGARHLRVFTRSLSSAKPIGGVEVTLIARNNEILGTSKTDADGQAIFDAGLMRGTAGLAPAMVTAKTANNATDDFVFIDMLKPGFDFSDRGVTGRPVPKGVDVYAWTERGIYRAGETVYASALARDISARAIDNLPLTFVFKRPDGVEDRRMVGNGASLGGYAVELALTKNARSGTWQMQIFTDPKSDPVAEHLFLVEDFLPEKTDFTLTPASSSIEIGGVGTIDVNGRYLYGAPASGLSLDGEMVVRSKRNRKGYLGYLFGLAENDDGLAQQITLNQIAPLDEEGSSSFDIVLTKTIATTRLQYAEIVVRMRESGGRAIERRAELDIIPQDTMIGIDPQFDDGQIGEGSHAAFNIIAVDRDGNKTGLSGANWSLVRIDRDYQWYRSGSSWHYESIDIETKVADGVIDVLADGVSKLSVAVEWGRYRLEVETTADGAATSVEFNAGWYVKAQTTQTPDGLEMALDKAQYKAGDIAKLQISPRFAGEMLIAIGTERIIQTRTVAIPASGASIDIEIGDDWGAGAYILATLYRPQDLNASSGKSRMPARAIGVKWIGVDPNSHEKTQALELTLDAPARIEPHKKLIIPVSVTGLSAGEEAYVSVAAVDIGILNLTSYKSPDPVKHYFGQRKLGIAMRDIYGRLIDGGLGSSGRLRTGGDGMAELSASGNPPSQKLVAFFTGPVRLDEQGKASIEFDIPQFNGTVRIMATAWSAAALGAVQAQTIIRDEVVISASLPKFMAPGDAARMLVEFTNTDAEPGRFDLDYEFSENIILGQDDLPDEIELASGKRTSLPIHITAGASGEGWARIILSRPDGFIVAHDIAMNIRAGILPVTTKLKVPLIANGGSLTINKNLIEGNILDGAKVNISVGLVNAIDVPSLLMRLDRYPYGCAEQITSKALPLLYISDFPDNIPGTDSGELRQKIQVAINTVLSYQSSSGGFSLWGNGRDDLWLGAYVTDFLTRANEKGYVIPASSLRQSLQNLQNVLAYQNNLQENDAAIAYSLYVLARNRLASAGDLRYYVDTQMKLFKTPVARAQLAAAMALYGDGQRSEQAFSSAFKLAIGGESRRSERYNYGSKLRDAAAMLALASESRPAPSNTSAMKILVAALSKADRFTNTQEQAWMVLAARASVSASKNISLSVNGLPFSGAFSKRVDGNQLVDAPIQVTNRNDINLEAIITTLASPKIMPPAGGKGFTINRTYYRLDGSEANIAEVKQNERFVVVLNLKQLRDLPSRLIVTDLLPAGFEIDNPRLVKSAELGNFNWLPKPSSVHSEFLADRFITAFNRAQGGKNDFTVAYIVRAVTPGTFMHPAASVEDMYRPELFARTSTGWMRVIEAQ